ncbi:MAG: cation transporter [Bacteroidota bacterium]|nr:cation transporter [Bacteroidota bacterium]
MKKFSFLTLVALSIFFSASAQTKALQIAKISTPTIQCEMCKTRIEEYLKRIDGVTFVNVAVKKKEVNVKFLSDRTNIEMIKASIANAGFDAAEIAANPEAYKALPKCCKKPEDGGGMPKH